MPRSVAAFFLLCGVLVAATGIWHGLANPNYVHVSWRYGAVTPAQDIGLGVLLIISAVLGFLKGRPSPER